MQERCRLISESQWREYLELVTKCNRLEQQLESETLAKQEGVELVAELEQKVHKLEKQLDEAIGLLEEAHWHVNGDLLQRCIDFIKEYKG